MLCVQSYHVEFLVRLVMERGLGVGIGRGVGEVEAVALLDGRCAVVVVGAVMSRERMTSAQRL